MKPDAIQERCLKTWYPKNHYLNWNLIPSILGLVGEAGELANLLKKDEFKPGVSDTITNARQYHDGRWFWLRVLDRNDTDDMKRLVQIKKKPQKKRP